jgi:succinate dehydrogenase / fumarate reductase membrane anchor subunit
MGNKAGLGHWLQQRLTALALVPLLIWLVCSLALLGQIDHATLIEWVARPYAAILLIVTVPAVFWHGALGMHMVLGDYVGSLLLRRAAIIAVNFGAVLFSLISIGAVLKIAIGAGA